MKNGQKLYASSEGKYLGKDINSRIVVQETYGKDKIIFF